MTHQETNRILEGNKSIAVFMGGIYLRKKDPFDGRIIEYIRFEKGVFRDSVWDGSRGACEDTLPELLYHRYWDWLMPVVEKIESIHDDYHGYFAVHIVSNSCTIQGTKFDSRPESFHPAYFADYYHDTKLLATYEAVVNFIQWYTTKQSADE